MVTVDIIKPSQEQMPLLAKIAAFDKKSKT